MARLRLRIALAGLFVALAILLLGGNPCPQRPAEPDGMVFLGITPISASAALY